MDPLSGHLFLFRNRRGDLLEILTWDRSGVWILYKRIEQGTFAWPMDEPTGPVEMRGADLAMLLAGDVDPRQLGSQSAAFMPESERALRLEPLCHLRDVSGEHVITDSGFHQFIDVNAHRLRP